MAALKIEIKSYLGSVLFSYEKEGNTVKDTVQAAVAADADLRGADLRGAVLRDADLSGAVLRDADLRGADLRGAVLRGADLSGAVLRDADLRGADLRGAVLRDADLSGAVLRDADLRGADLRGAVLRGAVLRGADLSGAVLRDADLRGADLSGAVLRGAVLRGADLRGAVLSGVPFVPQLHSKMAKAIQAPGNALRMSNWHTCDTTHCRAGWAIHLAGEAGYALEAKTSAATAGLLIYLKAYPNEPIPDFYADNETAKADILRCSELEQAHINQAE